MPQPTPVPDLSADPSWTRTRPKPGPDGPAERHQP